jgi:hypothetical protein
MNSVGRPPLDLKPLPTWPSQQTPAFAKTTEPGFVDDSVIEDILRRSSRPAALNSNQELALSADDMDFAGWHAISRPVAEPETPALPPKQEFSPVTEPGLGNPQRETPRWWLAGLATVGSLIALSLSLMTVQRPAGNQSHPAIIKSKMVWESIWQSIHTETAGTF